MVKITAILRKFFSDVPPIAMVGAFWIVANQFGVDIPLGPTSLSGVLSVLTLLFLVFLFLFALIRGKILASFSLSRENRLEAIGLLVLLVLTALMVASVLFESINGRLEKSGAQNVLAFCTFFLIVVLGSSIESRIERLAALRVLRLTAALMAFVLLILQLSSNYVGRAPALLGIIIVAVTIVGKPENALVRLAPYAMTLAVLLGLNRTASALCFLLLAAAATRSTRPHFSRRIFVGFVAYSALYAATVFFYQPLRDRFIGGDNAVSIGGVSLSTQGRVNIWSELEKSDSPSLLGNGAGASTQVLEAEFGGISLPHNEYLRLYYDYGEVGFYLFVLVLGLLAVALFRKMRDTSNVLAWIGFLALATIGLSAVTDNPFIYIYAYLPMGLLVGLGLSSLRERKLNRESGQ
jgi:hypothetical protein